MGEKKLSELRIGEKRIVAELYFEQRLRERLFSHGIRPNEQIEVMQTFPGYIVHTNGSSNIALEKKVADLISVYQKRIWVNGCFDLLHDGHLDLLREAKAQGDYLIVGLNSDYSVKKNKGETRPIDNQETRKRKLLETELVDEVIIYDDKTPIELIKKVRPDLIVKGHDQYIEPELANEFNFYKAGKQKDISTTKIIEASGED